MNSRHPMVEIVASHCSVTEEQAAIAIARLEPILNLERAAPNGNGSTGLFLRIGVRQALSGKPFSLKTILNDEF